MKEEKKINKINNLNEFIKKKKLENLNKQKLEQEENTSNPSSDPSNNSSSNSSNSSNNSIEILYSKKNYMIETQPDNVHVKNIEKFDINNSNLINYFNENGFVIIKNIATENEINNSTNLFWNFIEENSNMKRDDISTWTDNNFRRVGSTSTGILAGAGFGQSDFLWSLRTIPNVSHAFNLLYNRNEDNQLITSFDGGVMFRPWHHPDLLSNCTQSGWFHVDQGRTLRGLQCIQGMLTLTNADETTGGLCLIPKSHLYHDELMETIYREGNYIPIPPRFHVLQHEQILPCCSAGN